MGDLAVQCLASLGRCMGFVMDTQHPKFPRRAIRLEIDAADQPVAEQERKVVIAVGAALRRRIDADPVMEVEQPLRAGTFPDQRIERG